MPVCGPLKPIHRTDVPVKVNAARAAGVVDTAAVPPLHGWVVSPAVQPAVKVVAEAVSSTRVPVVGGGDDGETSNASTTTAQSDAAAFFEPVDSIVNV